MNIAGDDVLLPPNAEGKVFCTICKGGPMQVTTKILSNFSNMCKHDLNLTFT